MLKPICRLFSDLKERKKEGKKEGRKERKK
jgi:hypothetical protein